MRGVPDAEEPRAILPREPVHPHRQEAHVLPAAELPYPVPLERHDARDAPAERLDAMPADLVDRALGDDVAALPVGAAVDQDEDPPVTEAAHARGPVIRALG